MTMRNAATGEESTGPESGRRERKKAATRASISGAALKLFLEHGFEAVSIRDIANEADVAVATIFAHFSGKEALVFDEDDEVGRSLFGAIDDRARESSVLDALQAWFAARHAAENTRRQDKGFDAFRRLIESTPQLRDYWKSMWRRYESGLAEALERAGMQQQVALFTATLTIEGYLLAAQGEQADEMLDLLFVTLRRGLPSQLK